MEDAHFMIRAAVDRGWFPRTVEVAAALFHKKCLKEAPFYFTCSKEHCQFLELTRADVRRMKNKRSEKYFQEIEHSVELRKNKIEPNYLSFKKIVLEKALPILIDNINSNYNLNLKLADLDILFDPSIDRSRAYGSKKIVFGKINAQYIASTSQRVCGGEYLMFKNDLDLWTHDVFGWEFVAWWVSAHELAHTVANIFRDVCKDISEPIIPNVLKAICEDKEAPPMSIGDYPKLEDLLVNQAYWIRQGSSRTIRLTEGGASYSQPEFAKNLYTVNEFESNNKIFLHGVFFQHIYRTLRREVVNPMFDIPVGNWKQKSKPRFVIKRRIRYYISDPLMYEGNSTETI